MLWRANTYKDFYSVAMYMLYNKLECYTAHPNLPDDSRW